MGKYIKVLSRKVSIKVNEAHFQDTSVKITIKISGASILQHPKSNIIVQN